MVMTHKNQFYNMYTSHNKLNECIVDELLFKRIVTFEKLKLLDELRICNYVI